MLEAAYYKQAQGKRITIEDTKKNVYTGELIDLFEDRAVIDTQNNRTLIYNIAFISFSKKQLK